LDIGKVLTRLIVDRHDHASRRPEVGGTIFTAIGAFAAAGC
jgi:hypothetical protein